MVSRCKGLRAVQARRLLQLHRAELAALVLVAVLVEGPSVCGEPLDFVLVAVRRAAAPFVLDPRLNLNAREIAVSYHFRFFSHPIILMVIIVAKSEPRKLGRNFSS